MTIEEQAMSWYLNLPVHNRIELKKATVLLCGMEWEKFTILFSPRERLNIVYRKLKMEGFDV